MLPSLRKQRGHAALLFALIIPGVWGLFTLAIDGSRALQNKARLGDAAEVSALALAARNSENEQENRALATLYIDAYLEDKESIQSINIIRTECKASSQTDCDGGTRYNEYAIDIVTTHNSWLPTSGDLVGFGETYDVSHDSVARKYQGDSIDISFVVDYSGSMNENWKGKKKYKAVREIVNSVLDELDKYQDTALTLNRVSIIPYSEYTDKLGSDGITECRDSQLLQQCRSQCYSTYSQCYSSCNSWDWNCRNRCTSTYYDCEDDCYDQYDNRGTIEFIDELHYANTNSNTVDPTVTVNNIWNNQADNRDMVCNFDKYDNDSYPFFNLSFTDNFTSIKNSMKNFRPDGWTGSYQGIIKSAQFFGDLTDPNPRQLMVILSDGLDKVGSGTFRNGIPTASLVNAGMCTEIKAELNSRQTNSNRPVNFQMAFVGFDYTVSDNQALANCVGIENVYDAADPDELLDIILNLISEEIGHLK
ncbi:TadE/TadG family type IV pilus assembly protein [Vibrio sp. 99-70-13A1]|uniref:TadE/TadG family type IV pilus assembly protein n=1 Tax=Vibrio sp. 99-70-13A1 TaxID=2607601 RepID=UPI0020A5CECE|nr:TadE/TadG family type IV pilus assembly protein [Vibrio sp. 99-70-13A1]